MLHTKKEVYLTYRGAFAPERTKLVIVAESPPVSGLYFYNPDGKVTEPLFAAMMRQLTYSPRTKEDGLREFQGRGWLLVDATYEPVNGLGEKARDVIIVRDYPLLRSDLETLLPNKAVPIALVKANVCRLLEPWLNEDGFKVLNRGAPVYFPSNGRQAEFHKQFAAVLKSFG
jgi:hypothetical protein